MLSICLARDLKREGNEGLPGESVRIFFVSSRRPDVRRDSDDGYRRMSWHGLAWYEFDAGGKPCKKGIVECSASRQVVVGPGQKDLYLKVAAAAATSCSGTGLPTDGKPAKAGEADGKGIGPSSHDCTRASCKCRRTARTCIASPARTMLSRASEPPAPGGAISYRGPVDLTPVAKRDPANDRFQWVSLGISADGRWLYAGIRNGKPSENFYGIFQRDAATGDLTFRETISGDKDPLANQHAWSMVSARRGRRLRGQLDRPDHELQLRSADGAIGRSGPRQGHQGLRLAVVGVSTPGAGRCTPAAANSEPPPTCSR